MSDGMQDSPRRFRVLVLNHSHAGPNGVRGTRCEYHRGLSV